MCGPRMRPATMERRRFLTSLGAGGVGVVLLGACSSGDSGSSATTGGPTTTATTAPTSTTTVTTVEATDDAAASESVAEVQLLTVELGFVSAFVLLRGDEAAIVDTGVSGSERDIIDSLVELDIGPSQVRHVVLTHKHGDHVGALEGILAETTRATVYAGEGDIDAISASVPVSAVAEGDEILGLGVVETPGHTPGSISLFDTGTGLLVAGDAINGSGQVLTGANPDFSEDLDVARQSVAKLAALQPRVAAFGHVGPPVTTDVTAQLAALA
ncbi:MAG: MBL fold metallo-hydrolase [Actinomycetota bacterium]